MPLVPRVSIPRKVRGLNIPITNQKYPDYLKWMVILRRLQEQYQGGRVKTSPKNIPNATIALRAAIEGAGFAPEEFYPAYQIMMKESGGQVGVKNYEGSGATGLYQLMPFNWHYMPYGQGSIGDPYGEALGGMLYIKNRYKTPTKAWEFWQKNRWY